MSKYIKLEDAIHNINLEVTGRKEYTGDMKANLFFALDDLPTIEIVRCKDCKWYKDFDGCFFSTAECEPEHFCSWGERQSADETLREICRDFIGIVEETRKDND